METGPEPHMVEREPPHGMATVCKRVQGQQVYLDRLELICIAPRAGAIEMDFPIIQLLSLLHI